jgi:hypothetical protein
MSDCFRLLDIFVYIRYTCVKKDVITMPFEPLKLSRHGGNSVTLDVLNRLRISAEAMRTMKISAYQYVVVSVDVDSKRVGLVKQELAKVPNASAVKVDKRGYLGVAAGKEVAKKLALSSDALPAKFDYIGYVDEAGVRWSAFELVKVTE